MSEHEWLQFAAPYALGSLDREEAVSFEAHLATCDVCQRGVQEFREVAGTLAYSATRVSPPATLRQRILREASRARPRAAFMPRWIPWLAAAASIALAIAAGIAYRDARSERLALERAYEELRATLAGRDSLLAAREVMLAALFGAELRTATLTTTGGPPSARLFWNPDANRVVVVAFNLPPAPPGRTYQLWGIPTGGTPLSLGIFNTSPDGRTSVAFAVPAGAQMDVSAITDEPAGGSSQPTTTPFLVGSWTEAR
ncbi:MAG: anti-sigma factor [Gemmatimonadetes bacterium]|nr:anti-sigma factor [Gemmatimonadota bacterium]